MRVGGRCRAPQIYIYKKKFWPGCCYTCGLFERAAPQPESGCASAQSSGASGPFHGWDSGAPAGHDAVTPGKSSPVLRRNQPGHLPVGGRREGAGPAGPAGPAANTLSCWMFLAARTARRRWRRRRWQVCSLSQERGGGRGGDAADAGKHHMWGGAERLERHQAGQSTADNWRWPAARC